MFHNSKPPKPPSFVNFFAVFSDFLSEFFKSRDTVFSLPAPYLLPIWFD